MLATYGWRAQETAYHSLSAQPYLGLQSSELFAYQKIGTMLFPHCE